MEALKRARRPVRKLVTTLVTEIEKLLNADPIDQVTLEAKYRLLQEAHNNLVTMDLKVTEQQVDDNASEQDQDTEYGQIQDYRMKMELVRVKVEKVTTANQVSSPNGSIAGSHASRSGMRSFKLPKVQLRKFSGQLKDWLGYWAQFEKIHTDSTLHGSDKFHYLIQSMEPGTDAYEIVNSYPQSNENYSKAVTALQDRFGNKDLLLQVYIRELLKLVISNVNSQKKIPFQSLFLKLDSHLRALKTLDLEKADPATWLFPLVESSLPEDILLTWQRSPLSTRSGDNSDPPKTRLDNLMEFLGKEVDIRQKISLAQSTFHEEKEEKKDVTTSFKKRNNKEKLPTLMGCHSGEVNGCIFCGKTHESKDCFKARKMSLEEKNKIVREKRVCFKCLGPSHVAKKCRARLQCMVCGRQHVEIMCRGNGAELESKSTEVTPKEPETLTGMANVQCSRNVALQILMVIIKNGPTSKKIRAFLDPGSQRSYLLKTTAMEVGLSAKAEETVRHSLFGGAQTASVKHGKYDVVLQQLNGKYQCKFEVRDQWKIVNQIPRISPTTSEGRDLLQELKKENIVLTDVGNDSPPIEMLIGGDIYGRLLTGKVVNLRSGVVAIETKLGWVLMGEAGGAFEESISMSVIDMAVTDATITQLWDLDTIGIRDDIQVKSAALLEQEVKATFMKTIERKADGRYLVSLPWKDGHPKLPLNKDIATQKLNKLSVDLEDKGLFQSYGNLLREWEEAGIIERVPAIGEGRKIHYLSHRAVLKPESFTTPIRPVFNASLKIGKAPSLNECLHTGPNLIQRIPEILYRFREKKIGFVSDIRKAFQMIEVKPEDRDAMRFLWWSDYEKRQLLEYRHVRVMFGATCSPFILGAVLEHHLSNVAPEDQVWAKKLLASLYVDNSVYSTDTVEEYKAFRVKSTELLAEAKMDLRLWMSNVDELEDPATRVISVLGVMWDREKDELFVNVGSLKKPDRVSKRTILAAAQKIFDPLGMVCPAIIPIKALLQDITMQKRKWDEDLQLEHVTRFRDWIENIKELDKVRIPRSVTGGEGDRSRWQIHCCTDASKAAYSCTVFLRIQHEDHVSVQLLAAKARVSPVGTTIPRLELLGCLTGTRVTATIKTALELKDVPEFYWSDSTTALAWIRRNDQWGTFVGNRVKEICMKTRSEDWKHVPGTANPADLPSRGCTPSYLPTLSWWEGPTWMKLGEESWSRTEPDADESVVRAEKRKTELVPKVTTMAVLDGVKKQHSFNQMIRITGWVLRFIFNCKTKKTERKKEKILSAEEVKLAEVKLIKSIQEELFSSQENLRGLQVIMDKDGVIRVKTRLSLRDDLAEFKFPAILPRKHVLVNQLIEDTHRAYCHAGVGFLMVKLRSKYWILHSRRTIKGVVGKCPRCRRLSAKPAVTETAPLPENRVKDADVWEVIGIDLAGPLFLKNNSKVWVVVFTCAIYRAVNLELVNSLSTRAFIRAFKMFVKKHRRPEIVYSDNGTNFRGAFNLFKGLDWDKIKKHEDIKPIQWIFNPPSAAWWGGMWERLIRSMKDLMKRTIGKATLNRPELEKLLATVEEVMNGRPLTYVTEDPEDLQPLTPAMFVKPPGSGDFPEESLSEANKLRFRYQYVQTMRHDLKQRFRREYLAQLVGKARDKPTRSLEIGELVFVGSDNTKRIEWPLGRIIQLIPGKDGVSRVARVRTEDGVYTRPVQRLFPLELSGSAEAGKKMNDSRMRTRYGREVKAPKRF